MLSSRHPRRPGLVLVAVLLFTAACGGSSSPKPTAQSTDTNSQSSQAASSGSSDSDSSSSSSGGGGAPIKIFDATYGHGTAHVELSGDASKTVELTAAGGVTISGATTLAFTDADNQNAFSVSISPDPSTPGGISATVGGTSTAGELGANCQLTVTKNDASEFAGKIQCNDMQGIEGGKVYDHLKVTATFSATA